MHSVGMAFEYHKGELSTVSKLEVCEIQNGILEE